MMKKISEKEIIDRVEKLKQDFLRDIDEIYESAFRDVKEIIRKSEKKEAEKIKNDLKLVKS